jgi:hypothetical protein
MVFGRASLTIPSTSIASSLATVPPVNNNITKSRTLEKLSAVKKGFWRLAPKKGRPKPGQPFSFY